jgi:hypothetical protein
LSSRNVIGVIVAAAMLVVGQGCFLDVQGDWQEGMHDVASDPDVAEITGDVDDGWADPDAIVDMADDTGIVDTVMDTVADADDPVEDTEPDLPPCDGPMTLYYIDGDDDGYGDIGGGIEWCTQPAGFVENHDDCMDTHPEVHPGQTDYFSVDRGDGSFDYNCDLHQTLLYTSTTECHDWDCDGDGWAGTTVPACGVTATWRRCFWEWFWCNISETDRTQLCL